MPHISIARFDFIAAATIDKVVPLNRPDHLHSVTLLLDAKLRSLTAYRSVQQMNLESIGIYDGGHQVGDPMINKGLAYKH